jgi:two-component system copper resistance phosphate regulon response regulator CusR
MRILLIEDSRKLADSVRLVLTKSGFEVSLVTDGELGLRMALSGTWDVVILDLMLPGLSGHEILRQMRERGCECHVLILTALGAVEDRVRGLQAGADDYLGKPFSFDELLARVQALTRRKHGHKSPVIRIADLEIDTAGRTVRRNGALVSLTNREYRLLELLALREGNTVSRAEIEEHLYGLRGLPLSNVVDSAICSIRAKLREQGEATLIHTRPRLGYVLSTEAP